MSQDGVYHNMAVDLFVVVLHPSNIYGHIRTDTELCRPTGIPDLQHHEPHSVVNVLKLSQPVLALY